MNKKEIDQEMKRYENQGFDYWQMDEIRLGLEAGVDVDKYADPKFNEYQMKQIQEGLENGVNVDKYANTKFDETQMYEIRKELKKEKWKERRKKPELEM